MGPPAHLGDLGLREYLQDLKSRLAPDRLAYLTALRDGSFGREDFVETQVQFLHAVTFFSRPMALLTARLPRAQMRHPLVANAHDEHGRGDLRFSHEQTFLQLLERLRMPPAEIVRRSVWPEVHAFNHALAGVCALDAVPTALATLGIIEDLFADISAQIGNGIVRAGWLTSEALIHYPLHTELDVAHAEAFFAPIRAQYSDSAAQRHQVEQGLELGGYVLLRLYEDLYRSRGRRVFRDPAQDDTWDLIR